MNIENIERNLQKQKNQFCFQGMEQDADLERTANLRLIQLLAYAPPGAIAIAIVQKAEKNYSASIEVSSPFRNFSASAVGLSAQVVVDRVLSKIEGQLFDWRFGSGRGRPGQQPGLGNLNDSSFAGG
jgi:hypothetical protein